MTRKKGIVIARHFNNRYISPSFLSPPMKPSILNVGYRSVNCYLVVTDDAKLLIDVGWPGGTPELKKSMAKHGLSIKDITQVLVSHYHIDHGGIAQELKDKGARLIVMETQTGHLNDLKEFLRPPMVFHEIKDAGNIVVKFAESRACLEKMGIAGEIISTPGHSPDHITLVLDEGIAFTGDLPPESTTEEGSENFKNWMTLRSMKIKRIFPAHGPHDIPLESRTIKK
jgi:ribonuclease/clavin/mitogillin